MKKILVAGAGNILLSDEGFGVHVLRRLKGGYLFPPGVTLYDAGTAGIYMAPVLLEHAAVLFIDAIQSDAPPGTLYLFQDNAMEDVAGSFLTSPHQVGLLDVMALCRLEGWHPSHQAFLGVVPGRLAPGLELSPEVAAKVGEAVEEVVGLLESWGVTPERRCGA